jgi:hypothetical protein
VSTPIVRTELNVLDGPRGTQYVCPGESQPISRSVHLARMAAFYPKCRDCALRQDVGQLPRSTVEKLASTVRRIPRESLVAADGLRGVFVNELDRSRVERIAARFASLVWEGRPFDLTPGRRRRAGAAERRWSPRIVVGRDERASSPAVANGVVASLRRMGCRVVDVHEVARPVFWFAVEHLRADGGMLVTGSGAPPSWTGFDFVGPDGLPIVDAAALDALDRPGPVGRPTRHGGEDRAFDVRVPYTAGLWRHFHALRPLRIVIGSASRTVRGTLTTLFARLPCRPTFVEVPQRVRDLADPRDADVLRVSRGVRRERADLGVLIDDDGQRTAFVDERGRTVEAAALHALLARGFEEESGDATGLVDPLPNAAAALRRLRETAVPLAASVDGRAWFREPHPTSDAVLVLARVLGTLSLGDAPLSRVVRGTARRAA